MQYGKSVVFFLFGSWPQQLERRKFRPFVGFSDFFLRKLNTWKPTSSAWYMSFSPWHPAILVGRLSCLGHFVVKKNLGGGNSNIFYFHPYFGKMSNWTNIFQMG